MEERTPSCGITSHLSNDFVSNGGGFCTPRQHRQLVVESGEIEFDHHAAVVTCPP
jgi:hypothetical protein